MSMNKSQTFTDLDKAIAQTEKTIGNIETQMNMYIRLWPWGFDKEQPYDDLLHEMILQLTILDALQAKKRALKKEVLDSYRNNEKWNRYLKYLLDWTEAHQCPKNAGCSPAGFDEWASWELSENEECVECGLFGDYIPASGMKEQP